MLFSEPIPFEEAIDSIKVKTILPTSASSAQLATIAPELRERAFFSSRTTNAAYLQDMENGIADLLQPDTVIDQATGKRRKAVAGEYANPATVRTNLKMHLASIGYAPEKGKEGGLQDLSSDRRLDLIIDTNTKMAHGYGNWQQGQHEAILDLWPAQELYRAETRKIPRKWQRRWVDAGGHIYGGRMIALKNSSIWTKISRFRLPYPPFDYNSGMSIRDIDHDQAIDLGLITEDTKIMPQARPFNEDLTASNPVPKDSALFPPLMKSLDGTARLISGVLHFIES